LTSAFRISSKAPPASTLANAEGKDPAEVLSPQKTRKIASQKRKRQIVVAPVSDWLGPGDNQVLFGWNSLDRSKTPPSAPRRKARIPVAKFFRQVAPRRARLHLPKKTASSTRRWSRGVRPPRLNRKGCEILPLLVRHQLSNQRCLPQTAALNQFGIRPSITLATRPSRRRDIHHRCK